MLTAYQLACGYTTVFETSKYRMQLYKEHSIYLIDVYDKEINRHIETKGFETIRKANAWFKHVKSVYKVN